jgi:hypothetical protein
MPWSYGETYASLKPVARKQPSPSQNSNTKILSQTHSSGLPMTANCPYQSAKTQCLLCLHILLAHIIQPPEHTVFERYFHKSFTFSLYAILTNNSRFTSTYWQTISISILHSLYSSPKHRFSLHFHENFFPVCKPAHFFFFICKLRMQDIMSSDTEIPNSLLYL